MRYTKLYFISPKLMNRSVCHAVRASFFNWKLNQSQFLWVRVHFSLWSILASVFWGSGNATRRIFSSLRRHFLYLQDGRTLSGSCPSCWRRRSSRSRRGAPTALAPTCLEIEYNVPGDSKISAHWSAVAWLAGRLARGSRRTGWTISGIPHFAHKVQVPFYIFHPVKIVDI